LQGLRPPLEFEGGVIAGLDRRRDCRIGSHSSPFRLDGIPHPLQAITDRAYQE
jgi:hypothetical protein